MGGHPSNTWRSTIFFPEGFCSPSVTCDTVAVFWLWQHQGSHSVCILPSFFASLVELRQNANYVSLFTSRVMLGCKICILVLEGLKINCREYSHCFQKLIQEREKMAITFSFFLFLPNLLCQQKSVCPAKLNFPHSWV